MALQPTGIFYWNIHGQSTCLAALTELITDRQPGVVMLAECAFGDDVVLAALGAGYRACSSGHGHVKFYTTRSDFSIENDSLKRLVMARLGEGAASVLLVGVHLPSKLFGASPNQQAHKAEAFRRLIEEQEQVLGIARTVVFGDFNMNPYEWGMADRNRGFRTVPTRQLALQSIAPVSTTVRYFYNPMWAWLGDYFAGTTRSKPAGTYLWSPRNSEDTHWNTLDAVIVSPEAVPQFDVSSLEIVTHTASHRYLFFEETTPNTAYSDHLPLYFQLAC